MLSINSPSLLHISDGFITYYGANQAWYPSPVKRQAGCGPTVCAHLLWYLSRTRTDIESLCPYDGTKKSGFLSLMEDVWKYVAPGMMGVNRTSIFAKGAIKYGFDRGVRLASRTLDIPVSSKPTVSELLTFLSDAFSDNLPIGFLNLSNGNLENLESWHWVTLLSISPKHQTATMYDQEIRQEIDLATWLKTTALGGGLVVIDLINT